MKIDRRRRRGFRRQLALFALTAAFGCLRLSSPPVAEDAHAAADLSTLAASWYGPLLNSTTRQPAVWRPADGFAEADATVQALADEWHRRQRRVQRHMRWEGLDRAAYYATIDELSPSEDLLATRYRLQSALAGAMPEAERARVETLAITAEHAVLTRNAIFAANAFAQGELSLDEALPLLRRVHAFRSAFADELAPDLTRLDTAERLSCDATGGALNEALPDTAARLPFGASVRRLHVPSDENLDHAVPESRQIDTWEEATGKIAPSRRRKATGDNEGASLFAWRATPTEDWTSRRNAALFLWGVARPCVVALNGVVVGRISPPDGSVVSESLPLAAPSLDEDDFVVIVETPGKRCSTPPLRAIILLAH